MLHQTERGVLYAYALFDRRIREYLFKNLSETESDEFLTLDDAVSGNGNPFVWVPDLAAADVFYMRKQQAHVQQNLENSKWDYGLQLTEESRGTAVAA